MILFQFPIHSVGSWINTYPSRQHIVRNEWMIMDREWEHVPLRMKYSAKRAWEICGTDNVQQVKSGSLGHCQLSPEDILVLVLKAERF